MKPHVVIPFAAAPAAQNPNLRSRTASAQQVYLDAATVAFASVRRWNPSVDLTLVTNFELDAEHKARLKALRAEHRVSEFAHRPPAEFAPTFIGSLFLLDVLSAAQGDPLIIIDPDVFCVADLSEVMGEPLDGRVGVLPISYGSHESVNGLSAIEAASIHRRLGESAAVPSHFGGEVYVLPSSAREQLADRVQTAWADALTSFHAGRPYMRTEEHILNFALRALPRRDLSKVAKRIWTAHGYRTVSDADRDLVLWHLPAEKSRGFRTLIEDVNQAESWFWVSSRDEFIERAGQAFGMWNRSPWRLGVDAAAAILRSTRRLLRH